MTAVELRIFVSSPGDVEAERRRAVRTLERLQGDFSGYVQLRPILWAHEPKRALLPYSGHCEYENQRGQGDEL